LRVTLGQFNATVGDLNGNAEKMRRMYSKAAALGADLVVFPELALCGYPPEDLLLKKHFLENNRRALETLAAACTHAPAIVGFAEADAGQLFNSAAILQNGSVKNVYRKANLPNYGVFDEQRYFKTGSKPLILNIKGLTVAVTICRDIWELDWLKRFLGKSKPFHLLVNLSASPFYLGKTSKREKIISDCAKSFNCAVCYCNLIGGQDELIFDGRSVFADPEGTIATKAKAFDEDLLIADIVIENNRLKVVSTQPLSPQPAGQADEIYQALVLGTRDYTRKNGFDSVLLGLSGGIDSSVVAAIAAAALTPENVTGITMPSKFNSPQTIASARKVAENLGIRFLTIPIAPVLGRFDESLQIAAGWNNKTIAYENLQARIRGTILMSLSNQFGSLVLTSSNKSETAVGYATLYGDTAGGFAVIKDVPKTLVYRLAEHINRINDRQVIPADVISRPPTAELREGQKDTDSLPPYDLLDKILEGYVEQDKSARQLVESGLPEDVVFRVINMVDRNEYKRRQSPPGVKITPKAFGKDRRLPITNRYRTRSDID
jgi:NAD+ synthase (glutamine-hydrolysing)